MAIISFQALNIKRNVFCFALASRGIRFFVFNPGFHPAFRLAPWPVVGDHFLPALSRVEGAGIHACPPHHFIILHSAFLILLCHPLPLSRILNSQSQVSSSDWFGISSMDIQEISFCCYPFLKFLQEQLYLLVPFLSVY